MPDLRLITYCGLYCDLCSARSRIPKQAEALRDSMKKEGYEYWGHELPGFTEFWKFLNEHCDLNNSCPGCREGGGPPFCGIRKCAKKRGIEICAFCDDFPCEKVGGIIKGYPTIIHDAARMKEIGIDAWIDEQKARAQTGFAYVDIRCHPYEVPEE